MLENRAQGYVHKCEPADKGERNIKAFSIAGHLKSFRTDTGLTLDQSQIARHLRLWNAKNSEPLSEHELVKTIQSAMASGTPRGEKTIATGQHGDEEIVELDAGEMHRPERFVTEHCSGLSVVITIKATAGVENASYTYLRASSGKRSRIRSKATLELEQETIQFRPAPSAFSVSQTADWSKGSREAWLAGKTEAPDAVELFDKVCSQIQFYLQLPVDSELGISRTMALWTMLTYGYCLWDAVPYLYVNGTLGSGKSRVFNVLGRMAFRPVSSSNVTGPYLFRTLDSQGGTFLYDEAEGLKESDAADIRSVLLAGYMRGGSATRLERIDDAFVPIASMCTGQRRWPVFRDYLRH